MLIGVDSCTVEQFSHAVWHVVCRDRGLCIGAGEVVGEAENNLRRRKGAGAKSKGDDSGYQGDGELHIDGQLDKLGVCGKLGVIDGQDLKSRLKRCL